MSKRLAEPTPGNTGSSSSPSPESLADELSELIPPLPTSQQSITERLPTSPTALGLPALPPLPNAPLGAQSAIPQANADQNGSMPRLTQSAPASMGYGSRPSPPTGATNTFVSHSQELANVELPGLGFSTTESNTNPEAEEFSAGRLIAVVGYEHILAGDMAVFVEPIIEQNRDKIPTGDEEKKIRSQLTRQALRQYVEIKAIYQEFFRDMVGTTPPKELAETKKMVTTKAGKIFFEKQVPVLMEKYKATTIAELEKKLQEKSLSLTTLRGQFIEQVLASELERKFVPDKFEVDRHDLINAYRDPANRQRWQVAGRVRWQQLTVRFDKHPTRQEAEAQIREMGNEVFLGGKPFESVAKQSSEGYTASEGGNYDWTTQGSLKSTELDQALFEIAPNSLSQIIADDIGLHIVRVLEREPGHEQDFTEAQVELREELSEERRTKEVREFRKRITDRTTVWTLWPEDIPGSRPLVEALGTTEPTL